MAARGMPSSWPSIGAIEKNHAGVGRLLNGSLFGARIVRVLIEIAGRWTGVLQLSTQEPLRQDVRRSHGGQTPRVEGVLAEAFSSSALTRERIQLIERSTQSTEQDADPDRHRDDRNVGGLVELNPNG